MAGETETNDPSRDSEVARDVIALAALQDIVIAPACVCGVAANLEIVRMHMNVVRTAAANAPPDPAEFLAP